MGDQKKDPKDLTGQFSDTEISEDQLLVDLFEAELENTSDADIQ